MPVQDPQVRNANFEEVALGYTREMAVNEAKRCCSASTGPVLVAARWQLIFRVLSPGWRRMT